MKDIEVIVYSKEECCLCDDAKLILMELSKTYPLCITEIDIYKDAALLEQYGMSIPVVLMDGEEVASGVIHKDVIIKFIKSAYRG